MAYCFSGANIILNNTIFIDTKIINKSSKNFQNLKYGFYYNPFLGIPFDDLIGTDVNRNLNFAYKGSDFLFPFLDIQYGEPPSIGHLFLSHPLNNAIHIITEGTTNSGTQGFPEYFSDYVNYLNGRWKDGTPLTYGGNGYGGLDSCKYSFPWDTDTNFLINWQANTLQNSQTYRMLPIINLEDLNSGGETCVTFAIVASLDTTSALASVSKLKQDVDFLKMYYQNSTLSNCSQTLPASSVDLELINPINIYPNPSSGKFYINFLSNNFTINKIEIFALDGRIIFEKYYNFNHNYIELMESGIFILKISDEKGNTYFKKILIQQ